MKTRKLKVGERMALAAFIAGLPIAALAVFLIRMSISASIEFNKQEMRGNAFQRPLEAVLNLAARHQAAGRAALTGDTGAKGEVTAIRERMDAAIAELALAYDEFGEALKFTDGELAARKRENARLSALREEWNHLKQDSLENVATGAGTAKLVAGVRAAIAHAGDISNLILDSDLDSYYIMDATLLALPQTQERLASIALDIGPWLRAGLTSEQRTEAAIRAALLRSNDVDRIAADVQTALNEDKNFRGISPSLETNLPAALQKYVAANEALLKLMDQAASGKNAPEAAVFEATAWAARSESFNFWNVAATELDKLIQTRVNVYQRQKLLSFGSIGVVALVVGFVVFAMVGGLNRKLLEIARELEASAGHVSAAATQVAESSTHIAEGATEQAASLEETSASLEEMTAMTKANAGNASRVNQLARQTRAGADTGAGNLAAMSQAMNAIRASSDDIGKIIKTIDEIAFQTNILALNAAVEAARAGQAGLGFAVVANEVRELAQRSAVAAKETAEKIDTAIRKASEGVEISGRVTHELNEIVGKIREVDKLAEGVATASNEQSQGVDQINCAVRQIDQVTQRNAASAEEGAAAAAELRKQASLVTARVTELTDLIGATASSSVESEPSQDQVVDHSVNRRNGAHSRHTAKALDALPMDDFEMS